MYLDSYVPNSYSVNYTFPYSSTLLESRKDLIINIFQPSGTTLPSMEDLPTIKNQPTTEESQCQVKILNNFPQIPHNRKHPDCACSYFCQFILLLISFYMF